MTTNSASAPLSPAWRQRRLIEALHGLAYALKRHGEDFEGGQHDGLLERRGAELESFCAALLAEREPEPNLEATDLLREAQDASERRQTLLASGAVAATEREEGYDLIKHLHRQRAFSARTFGPGARVAGVLDHIRRELVEIEQHPTDLYEWIDVVLLAFDGAWRSGASPEMIAAALAAKQARNERRQWPDWRLADPDHAITHLPASAEEPTP